MAVAHASSPLNSFHTYYIPGTIPERIECPCGLRIRVSEEALGLVFWYPGFAVSCDSRASLGRKLF